MREKLAKLIDMKNISFVMVLSVFCYLSVKGKIPVEFFMSIVTAMVTFYFAHKANKEGV